MLKRLAATCYRRRWRVLGAWIVVLVGLTVLSQTKGAGPSTAFHLPESDSQQATDLLGERFPARSGDTADIVLAAPDGLAAQQPAIDALLAKVATIPHVRGVTSPFASEGSPQLSDEGTIAFAQIQFDAMGNELPDDVASTIGDLVHDVNVPGLQVELSGHLFEERKPPSGSEAIGLLAAIVILLVAFGSVLAMGLPILMALFSIGIGLALIALLANLMSVPDFTSTLAAMIGIGVGIDYALFIVTRYRQGLHEGLEPEGAVVKAIATSGKAVLFAGVTVVISLAGMFLMGIDFVRGLATGALLAVTVTVLASLTFLPALLGFVGHNIDRLRLPWTRRDAGAHRKGEGFWYRWSRLIQRRPLPAAAVGLAVLIALAGPAFSIQLGSSDASQLPTSDTTRRAYDLLGEGFGPGFNGPLLIVVEVPNEQDKAALPRVHDAIASAEGVQAASPVFPNPAGDTAVMQVFPTTSPQDRKTVELIDRLRDDVLPAATEGTALRAHVGGITAAFDDVATLLQRRLPLFIGAVLAFSFLLLLMVFRSVLVPLKAVVMNLLSIAAAYGVVVAVFQKGIAADFFGVGKGPIEAFLPMMMFAILFGLSMDYEVFLLSRMKEEYDGNGNDNREAVANGLAST
ncbi:MAG: putative drug exporter of the superfamily, partial [Actinomycetota bacterium]